MKKFDKNVVVKDIKSKIFDNFKIKVICFILAISMYFSVSLIQRDTNIYSSNLNIENLEDYLVISNNIPENIRIIAKDKRDVLNKVTEEDFNVRLNLEDVKTPNTYKKKLEWDIPRSMNSFFSSIRVEPSEIVVNIDRLSEKNVRIKINYIGTPSSGYVEKSQTVEPSFVRIQGPENVLEQIDSVETETINLDGIKESFRRQVNLTTDFNNVKILGRAEVYFEITEETDVVRFKFQDANFLNLRDHFIARMINEVTVTFKGPKNNIPNVTQDDFSISIDCANVIYPGEYTYPVNVVTKIKDFEVISISPERIKIIVENK